MACRNAHMYCAHFDVMKQGIDIFRGIRCKLRMMGVPTNIYIGAINLLSVIHVIHHQEEVELHLISYNEEISPIERVIVWGIPQEGKIWLTL